jgi:hypothetical protein
MDTGSDNVKKNISIVLVVLALCSLGFAQVAANEPIGVVTPPIFITPEPTTELPTEVPTQMPTEEPPITIWTTMPVVGGGKGYIDTYCNVDGASVSFDGRYQCTIAQGICTVGVSHTGYVQTVTVSKAGYATWSGQISGMPADKEHVAVYATLNPIPTQTTIPPAQNGAIYAQSNPAGAAIYLNGNLQGYSPVTIRDLSPGSYSMKASLSGYTPDTQLIIVYDGKTASYYPNLRQSPPAPRSTGTVSVTSTPNAVLVYVDGNYQGKAPLTVTLYPGSHSFRLSLPGYNDYTESVYVSANTNKRLNAVLNAAVSGTVSISSMPASTVWMDSNIQGTIPSSGVLTLYSIASGNHVFKVTASGFSDWINTVFVQPNAVTPISAILSPLGGTPTPAPVLKTGGFNIVSTPTGAEILIDNLFRGYTPSIIDGVSAGQHQVLLKYTGYIDYSTTVNVIAGQTTPLAISMQAAPTPTPESAPSPALLAGGLIAIMGMGVLLRRRS